TRSSTGCCSPMHRWPEVATDPFVAPGLGDRPRQEQNFAPGVTLPPARPWSPHRPGDLSVAPPDSPLFGRPGPNIGSALTLTRRIRDRLSPGAHETVEDAVAVVAELAMRRASRLGRAPVMRDVDVARTLLGYSSEAPPDLVEWRSRAVEGAAREYPRRR